jgi:hypothetical protein
MPFNGDVMNDRVNDTFKSYAAASSVLRRPRAATNSKIPVHQRMTQTDATPNHPTPPEKETNSSP